MHFFSQLVRSADCRSEQMQTFAVDRPNSLIASTSIFSIMYILHKLSNSKDLHIFFA